MPGKFNRNNNHKGFTLVELAIVLVIIGLIVSSVLVGQDLIKAAQLRATVRQYNEFQVGVNTFIGKYNGIPGDILASSATAFGLTGSGGDGGGTILDASSTYVLNSGEITSFWGHLTTSGKELISGTYAGTCVTGCTAGIDYPSMKYGSAGWGVYGVSGTNYFYAGMAQTETTTATTTTVPFIPLDAYNIDIKIDDGLPNTGNVTTGGATVTNLSTALLPSSSCASATTSTGIYVYATQTAACGLRFVMQTF